MDRLMYYNVVLYKRKGIFTGLYELLHIMLHYVINIFLFDDVF